MNACFCFERCGHVQICAFLFRCIIILLLKWEVDEASKRSKQRSDSECRDRGQVVMTWTSTCERYDDWKTTITSSKMSLTRCEWDLDGQRTSKSSSISYPLKLQLFERTLINATSTSETSKLSTKSWPSLLKSAQLSTRSGQPKSGDCWKKWRNGQQKQKRAKYVA